MAVRRSHSTVVVTIVTISLMMAASGFAVGVALSDSDSQVLNAAQESVEALVPVTERSLADSVVVSGIGVPGNAVTVLAQQRQNVARLVVTEAPYASGEEVANGSPVVVVSGRPVLLLKIDSTPYRNLHLGDSGDDVVALRKALELLGHETGDSGTFNTALSAALESLYADHGFTAPSYEGSIFFDLTEFVTFTEGDPVVVDVVGTNSVVVEDDVLVTLRTGANTVVARADLVDAQAFPVGAEVSVQGDEGSVEGTVVAVSEFKEASTDLLAGVDVEVAVSDGAMVSAGTPYTLSVSGETITGATVPLSALRERAGEYYVLREDESVRSEVAVAVVASSEGYAFLASNGDVSVGDLVVVE